MQNLPCGNESSGVSAQLEPERLLQSQPAVYLLIIEDGSSSVFRMPLAPAIRIGRSLDADLRLRHGSVSWLHAQLVRQGDDLLLDDLGSARGVQVNGERITGSRRVSAGDVLAIGEVLLVVQRGVSVPQPRLLDQTTLRQRLGEELELALRSNRPVAFLHLEIGTAPLGLDGLESKLNPLLRPTDSVGSLAQEQLLVIMPDLCEQEVIERSRRLLAALPSGVRGGYCACPAHARDVETLLLLARQAAQAASCSRLGGPDAAPVCRSIGGREIVVADPAMLRMYEMIERLGSSLLPVLIQGETGSGKEIAAAALHQASPRRGQRLLAINCAALPESLAESELFGHERGAFSGAVAQKAGLLESAPGGTLFLDEIAELPLPIQAKLLRTLETRRIVRLGETHERPVDVRLVAATHRNLEAEVKAGRFRQDLYFRLSAAVLSLPPLRQRVQELPLLARMFLRVARQRLGRPLLDLSDSVMTRLLEYPWPGNIRELQNDMEYLAAVVQEDSVEPWHLPPKLGGPSHESWAVTRLPAGGSSAGASPHAAAFRPLDAEVRELEHRRILEALRATGGIQIRAAELLGMPRRTFFAKVKQYGISIRAHKPPLQTVPFPS